ncbi:MAG: lipopolysaccharide transport periplasmic protein LptA [Gammaproteobacteria bacterium]|nr:MAG: lipopolysaccharide transport periplasmic protein LptA [Gammaproteobacteria bacterium]RLA53600.1 MAG: lipopolysaccharide transport periplasmic protein LptA [Gammaproteobacteria bacterium]
MQHIRRILSWVIMWVITPFMANILAMPAVFALPSDRQQPINIESDRAQRNDKTGITTYEGAVNIIQGTINIRADKVTVHTVEGKVSKIVCIGVPAHYQQQPEPEDGLVIARANTIRYELNKDMITLITNASLTQAGSTLTGELINYDLIQELVEARGDISGKQRIKMVIPPSQQQEAD